MLASKRVPPVAYGFIMSAVLALSVACSDGSNPTGRTGIDIVDSVLAAVDANDADALVPLIRIEETPCLRDVPAEATPLCLEDEASGSLVPTFTFGSCIGIGPDRATAAETAAEIIDQALTLHAVHEAPADNLYGAAYSVIFHRLDPPGSQTLGQQRGYALLLSEEQVVGVDIDCGVPAAELVEYQGLGDAIPLSD